MKRGLLIGILLNLPIQANNRIFYLIANPRASLVQFLRMIGNRGDMKVMHIPANWAYCHEHNFLDITEGWYRQDAPTTYEEAKNDILKEVEKATVFVGENTHTANDFLAYNPEFLEDPRVSFIFLVSHPHASIIAYYRKKARYFDKLPPNQLADSIGLKGLYAVREKLLEKGITPVLLKTEDLFQAPEKTVRTFCEQSHIPYIEEALHWNDLSKEFKNFSDYGWYTIEETECALAWHLEAIKSTGFSEIATFVTDDQGNPTFEEISNPAHRKICIDAYNKNIKYYELLTDKGNPE